MEPIYIVAFSSFILGILGYIITQFWVRPILRYRRIKHRITYELKGYTESQNEDDEKRAVKKQTNGNAERIRRQCIDLTDCFQYDLPYWYKLLLESRNESPLDACEHLLALANIRNPEHVGKRLEKAKRDLKIS
jgi:hypothetical protein